VQTSVSRPIPTQPRRRRPTDLGDVAGCVTKDSGPKRKESILASAGTAHRKSRLEGYLGGNDQAGGGVGESVRLVTALSRELKNPHKGRPPALVSKFTDSEWAEESCIPSLRGADGPQHGKSGMVGGQRPFFQIEIQVGNRGATGRFAPTILREAGGGCTRGLSLGNHD